MAKKVVWTLQSVQDRVNIYQFWLIHNKSETYSKKLEELFLITANLLAVYPELGTNTTKEGVRVKVIKTFKLFYSITPDSIEILRVWDSRQDPETLKVQ